MPLRQAERTRSNSTRDSEADAFFQQEQRKIIRRQAEQRARLQYLETVMQASERQPEPETTSDDIMMARRLPLRVGEEVLEAISIPLRVWDDSQAAEEFLFKATPNVKTRQHRRSTRKQTGGRGV